MRRRLHTIAGHLVLLALLGAAALWGAQQIYASERTARFQLNAPPGLLPAAGLNELESFPDRTGNYRWTDGNGVLKLPNPGGQSLLRLSMAGGDERSVPVELRLDGFSQRVVVAPQVRRYQLLLPPGAGDRLELRLLSPTRNEGERLLGVLVSDLWLRGGGSAPWGVVLALWVAIGGVFALLRQARMRPLPAAALVATLVTLALLWQGFEGWRFGLFSLPLLLVGAGSAAAVLFERRWPPLGALREQAAPAFGRADWGALALLLLLFLALRLPFLAAPDPVGDLKLSARQMLLLGNEGLAGAYRFGNDYMPLRLLTLRGLSLIAPALGATAAEPLPAATLVLLKLPGLLADLATLALLFAAARRWRSTRGAAVIAALYTLAPPVWINVAWWGQVDALLMLPLLASVLLLNRAHGRWSWLCWVVALLVKPQAIIIAPLLYLVTLKRYGCAGLAQGGAVAIGAFVAASLPLALVQGGAWGIVQAYVGAVERFPRLTNQAFNLWYLATLGRNGFDLGQGIGPLSYRLIGLAFTGIAALLVGLALLRRDATPHRLEGAGALALAFFLLPTQIHERYLFLALAFLVLRVASAARLLPIYLLLVVTGTINILGTLRGFSLPLYRLIADSPLPLLAAGANLVALLLLLLHLLAVPHPSRVAHQPVMRDA